VAEKHSDKLLLMVGPRSTDDYKSVGLHLLPNVKFTGAKDISELPNYLQHCDCAIIPFEYSILTKSIYPLKINEYLIAGKPVVATAFSEDIKSFKEVIYIAEEEEEFLEKIDQAILKIMPIE
jgi:glycosyltransferase involved in cell wall biosynthesis